MKEQSRKNNGKTENFQEENAQQDNGWKSMEKDEWEQQQPYLHWMIGVEGVGNRTIEKLIKHAGSPKAVYGMPEQEMAEIIPAGKAAALAEAGRRGMFWKNTGKWKKGGFIFIPLGIRAIRVVCVIFPTGLTGFMWKGNCRRRKFHRLLLSGQDNVPATGGLWHNCAEGNWPRQESMWSAAWRGASTASARGRRWRPEENICCSWERHRYMLSAGKPFHL